MTIILVWIYSPQHLISPCGMPAALLLFSVVCIIDHARGPLLAPQNTLYYMSLYSVVAVQSDCDSSKIRRRVPTNDVTWRDNLLWSLACSGVCSSPYWKLHYNEGLHQSGRGQAVSALAQASYSRGTSWTFADTTKHKNSYSADIQFLHQSRDV